MALQLSIIAIVVIIVLAILIFIGLCYVLFTRSSVHSAGGDENTNLSEYRDYRSIFQIICCCRCNNGLQTAQPLDSPNKKANRNSMEKYWSSDYSISGLTMSQSERRGTHKDTNIKKLKYKPTASVLKDGHRVRLQPDTESPKIDILKRTAILITTDHKTIGANVWGKVDDSLLNDGKNYPGFESKHHGWTLMVSGATVYWEELEEYTSSHQQQQQHMMPPVVRNSSSTGLGSAAFHLGDEEEALGSAKHCDTNDDQTGASTNNNNTLNNSTRSSNNSSNSSSSAASGNSARSKLKMSTNREGNLNYEAALAASTGASANKDRSSFMWLGSREESMVSATANDANIISNNNTTNSLSNKGSLLYSPNKAVLATGSSSRQSSASPVTPAASVLAAGSRIINASTEGAEANDDDHHTDVEGGRGGIREDA